MKNIILLLFVFSFCKNIYSQEGVQKAFYPDGKLKQTENYKNGKLDGEARYYYETGILKEVLNCKDGKKNGPACSCSEDGILH